MGSGKSVQRAKQNEKTNSTQNNQKSNESQSIDNLNSIPAIPSKFFDRKLLNQDQLTKQSNNYDQQTQTKQILEGKLQQEIDEEEEEEQNRKREECIEVIKSGRLEYLIHIIENKEINISDIIEKTSNSNIFHVICKFDKHRLLKYMIFILSEVSYEKFSETLYGLVNNDKQNILDICIQSNSIDCLKILFKVGGFSIEKKYQKYISLALSYNSQHAMDYITEKTRNGSNLSFLKINYSYISRFSNNNFKQYLLTQNQNLLQQRIDVSQFASYKFIDPTFLHIPQNVFGVNFNQNNAKDKQIIWLRPEKICKYQRTEDSYFDTKQPILFEKISPSNIIQGESMNCYFLAVLQSLSMSPKLVQEVFDMKQSKPEIGLYCCKFYLRGEVENIIIDDYLPCHADNKQLIYSKFYKNSIWVALLEKAWAKMQGSYFDTEQMLIEDAMECILPYPTEGFWIKDLTSEELLNILQNGITNNFLIVVTTKSDLKEEQATLIKNHAYSLLSLYIHKGEKIIKVKNPWGKNDWQGELQTSTNSKVLGLKKSLGNYFDDEKDGIFNITLSEFQSLFSYICIQYIKNGYKYQSFKLALKSRKAKYYKFKLNFMTKICLRLVQKKQEDGSYSKLELRLFKISEDVTQVCYNGQDCWDSQRVTYIESKSSFVDLPKGENEGKDLDSKYIKSFFDKIKPVQVSAFGSVQEAWDKYYRYLLKLENKGKQKTTYQSDILVKSNLILANPDIKILNKRSFQVELQPNSTKIIKFKIKRPIKKAKIMINHSFQ